MVRLAVLVAAAILVIGAAVAVIAWLNDDDEPDRSSVALACGAVHRAEPVDVRDPVDVHLMGAAEQFSRAAAVEDKARQPLAEAIEQLANLVFYESRPADSPELRAAVAAVDQQCGATGQDQESLAGQACAVTPTTIATGDVAARDRLIGAAELVSAATAAEPKYARLTGALRDAAGEYGLAMTPAAARRWLDPVHAVCRDLQLEP
ncbi:hypothetical protein [Labedaea rhizosphaerae]|uniref:Uncharacterized protein n=1 Tax=Labedaea rhizosphaerae TaxID=598644 RepID=A0A4R6SM32_LABRH|nr:hypothetical protein [Labedaea rhizosphaerae]TDQ05037.1 hypothetical protein EV186_1011001 [Labedaea rhizosphaerae]